MRKRTKIGYVTRRASQHTSEFQGSNCWITLCDYCFLDQIINVTILFTSYCLSNNVWHFVVSILVSDLLQSYYSLFGCIYLETTCRRCPYWEIWHIRLSIKAHKTEEIIEPKTHLWAFLFLSSDSGLSKLNNVIIVHYYYVHPWNSVRGALK